MLGTPLLVPIWSTTNATSAESAILHDPANPNPNKITATATKILFITTFV
jgi:hypothetical protein